MTGDFFVGGEGGGEFFVFLYWEGREWLGKNILKIRRPLKRI
jgi:hypothetical protein